MIVSHQARRRRLALSILALWSVLAGALLPPRPPAAAAAVASASTRLTTCDELLAVKEWTVNFSYAWDAEATDPGPFSSGQASMSEAGNIFIKFHQLFDEVTNEPLWRWQSVETLGTASVIGDDSNEMGSGYTRAVGSVAKNNLGDMAGDSMLEIDPESCTYNLHLWPNGPDGDTWEILSSGERVSWLEDEWHISSSLTLYNEPFALPEGDGLPQVVVSRMMPVDPVMPGGTGSGEVDNFSSGSSIASENIHLWHPGPVAEGESKIGATSNVFWSLTPEPFGRPTVTLDREFLERSIFLDQVPIDHWFDSQVSWGDDTSGTHTWKAASREPEVSGVTSSRTIRKNENLGLQGLGNQPLTTQVRNVSGAKSTPQTTNLWVAPEMSWCHNTVGVKVRPAVSYRCGFKFPEPSFEADVNLPSAIPWFGGKEFGIRETQASVDLEVKSTGEGALKGQGQTGFAAMGGSIIGSIAAKGDIVLGPDGVRVPLASLELALSGKVEKEEALIKAVPAFLAAMAWLEGINKPAAQWLAKRASAKLEIEPKIQVNLEFETTGDELRFKSSEVQPGIGFKVTTSLNFLEDENDEALLELRAGVGGEATVALQVPKNPNYLKKIELKFLAFFGLRIWRFLEEGEKAWTWASTDPAALSRPDAAPAAFGWSLMDRSYLQSADYARWSGLAATTVITDQQLMGNVDPLARPALALAPNGAQYLVWAHDKPGSPALSGQELAFASGSPTDWNGGWTQLTNDDRADFNPTTVVLPNGRVLALWQRLDTASPGDLNADPAGFLSHFQIAAATIDPGTPALTAPPIQLSASGRLSHRPHLGALGDGALALWVANDQNQILGAAASPDQVLWARYNQDAEQWSQPTPLLSGLAGLSNLQLATSYDPDTQISHAAVVYSLDRDGDLGTDADQELFVIAGDDSSGGWSWAAPQQLTANAVADQAPQLSLTAAGAPLLIWRQGQGLRLLQGGWGAQSQPLNLGVSDPEGFQLARGADGTLALVWKEVESHDTRIGYALYDQAHGLWSDARTVQPRSGSHSAGGTSVAVDSVDPVLISDSSAGPLLALAYQVADVKAVTRTLDGITVPNVPELGANHLRMAYVPLTSNLAVRPADLRALPANARVGQAVQLDAAIHNEGLVPVAGATVELVRESLGGAPWLTVGEQTLPAIPGGGVVTATFALARPERADYRYVVRVRAPEEVVETNLTDNEAVLGMEVAATTISTLYSPGAALAQVRIDSSAALPSTAPQRLTLTRQSPDGPVLHDTWFSFPVTATASVTVSMSVLKDDAGPGQHFLYWNVDPDQTLGERDRSDNTSTTLVAMQPDLAAQPDLVMFGRQPGATAPLRLWVRNEGNLASAAGTIGVYSSPPGQAGSRLLGTLSLPALEPGAVVEVVHTLSLGGQPEASTGLRTLAIQLDPANAQAELNENNNLIVVGEPFGSAAAPQRRVYLPLIKR